jgi:UDPglucose 6-dehydrogenase
VKIAIIGTGYVGLVAGACLADNGNDVNCVDIDVKRVTMLCEGKIPIFEPGLETLVERNVVRKRLTFTTDTIEAVRRSKVVFLAVPTPMDEDGSADLQHLLNAVKTVAKGINEYKVIVNKSTVPVGTAKKVRELISTLTDHPFDVVSNPEFLKEGAAVEDFLKPDRVIIGCDSTKAEEIITELYAPFMRTGKRIIMMRVESAELTKYTANAILATRISFINEIARLCELVGADIGEVRRGIGSDSRIGPAFLHAGMGFGGSCFPKDLNALIYLADQKDLDLKVIRAAVKANEIQKQFIPSKIHKHFNGNIKGLHFALWGLAFKANTDDMRESPAIPVIDYLLKNGAKVKAYDPQAMRTARLMFKDKIEYSSESYDALKDADALVIATEWNEFRTPDFEQMLRIMNQPVVFDGRNLFHPGKLREAGFIYYGIGQA